MLPSHIHAWWARRASIVWTAPFDLRVRALTLNQQKRHCHSNGLSKSKNNRFSYRRFMLLKSHVRSGVAARLLLLLLLSRWRTLRKSAVAQLRRGRFRWLSRTTVSLKLCVGAVVYEFMLFIIKSFNWLAKYKAWLILWGNVLRWIKVFYHVFINYGFLICVCSLQMLQLMFM